MSSPSDTVEPGPQRQSIDHHDERREERLRCRRQREKDRRASETQERQAWLVSVAETEQERLAEVRGKMYSCVADSLNVGQFICA